MYKPWGRPAADIRSRFESKYLEVVSGCWEWQGAQDRQGYGFIKSQRGMQMRAHRLSYELFYKKEIPENIFVCHKCDNPKCVNPQHLFLGTVQDNTQDMMKKGRHRNGSISQALQKR